MHLYRSKIFGQVIAFLWGFFKRNRALFLKRRFNLEKDRALVMRPTNIAEQYARFQQVYEEYRMCSGVQILNLDESGFSKNTAYCARYEMGYGSEKEEQFD